MRACVRACACVCVCACACVRACVRVGARHPHNHQVSSRSHAILILRLADEATSAMTSMFVVDLAGSERIARSGVTGAGDK